MMVGSLADCCTRTKAHLIAETAALRDFARLKSGVRS
jgi:hypothetical protein